MQVRRELNPNLSAMLLCHGMNYISEIYRQYAQINQKHLKLFLSFLKFNMKSWNCVKKKKITTTVRGYKHEEPMYLSTLGKTENISAEVTNLIKAL
jgi:hypothetical protein